MYQRVQNLFQWRADLLMANRLQDLAEQYVFPWTAYVESYPVVMHNADVFVCAMANMRANLIHRGTHTWVVRLSALDLPRKGRFRAWISYLEYDKHQNLSREARMIQYCRETPAGIHTEMTDAWGFGANILGVKTRHNRA